MYIITNMKTIVIFDTNAYGAIAKMDPPINLSSLKEKEQALNYQAHALAYVVWELMHHATQASEESPWHDNFSLKFAAHHCYNDEQQSIRYIPFNELRIDSLSPSGFFEQYNSLSCNLPAMLCILYKGSNLNDESKSKIITEMATELVSYKQEFSKIIESIHTLTINEGEWINHIISDVIQLLYCCVDTNGISEEKLIIIGKEKFQGTVLAFTDVAKKIYRQYLKNPKAKNSLKLANFIIDAMVVSQLRDFPKDRQKVIVVSNDKWVLDMGKQICKGTPNEVLKLDEYLTRLGISPEQTKHQQNGDGAAIQERN